MVLKRSRGVVKTQADGLASSPATSLQPQEPPFLEGLPPVGTVYEPKQPATKELKRIIDEKYYATNFENAIKAVSRDSANGGQEVGK